MGLFKKKEKVYSYDKEHMKPCLQKESFWKIQEKG